MARLVDLGYATVGSTMASQTRILYWAQGGVALAPVMRGFILRTCAM
ncbi:hypothetical protein [Paracoccus zhouxuedongae]